MEKSEKTGLIELGKRKKVNCRDEFVKRRPYHRGFLYDFIQTKLRIDNIFYSMVSRGSPAIQIYGTGLNDHRYHVVVYSDHAKYKKLNELIQFNKIPDKIWVKTFFIPNIPKLFVQSSARVSIFMDDKPICIRKKKQVTYWD